MLENLESSLEEKESINKRKNWWKWFWITIIILIIVYIGLNIVASKKLDNLSKNRTDAFTELMGKVQDKFPQLKQIFATMPEESKKSIKNSIDKNIDRAYVPVYKQIDNFSGFHYSVTGEYTELFMVLTGKIDKTIKEKIFNQANFDNALKNSLNTIHSDTNAVLKNYFHKISKDIQNTLEINEDETEFFMNKIIKFTENDMIHRFDNSLSLTFKGFGLAGGATAGVMTKIISKKMATAMAKKIATKAAIKGGTKIAGAAVGATTGAESGLFCGPGAWLCSPVGAIVGGTIGWFSTDKAAVEIDKYYNENEFKVDLKKMIDKQKQQTKQTLYKIYSISLNKLKKENQLSIEKIKSKKIIDMMKK